MPLLNRLVSAPAQRPPLKLHADTSLDEYDLNFALGEVPSSLEASGVRLVPVIVRIVALNSSMTRPDEAHSLR